MLNSCEYWQSRLRATQVFEDSETGAVFQSEESVSPERDRKGELAFRAVSYTPWPVEAGAEGDRVRVPVGPVSNTQPRTYVFPRWGTLHHASCMILPGCCQ